MEAKELRRIARENLSGNWGLSIGVSFMAIMLGGLITNAGNFSVSYNADTMHDLPGILVTYLKAAASVGSALSLVQFILGGTINLGYAQYLLKQYNKANFEFRDLFSQFHRFGQGFAQHFLRGLYTALWMLLFIIPGIIKAISYSMTPFIMAENPDMTAKDAINASKELMHGHKMDLFLLGLSFIGWSLLSILTLGIGSIFLNPYINAAYAAFYKKITATETVYE